MSRHRFAPRPLAAAALLAVLAFPVLLRAQGARPEDVSDRVDARTAFHQLKGLAGDWKGTVGKENLPATVTYRVGSNGTIVVETLFPGTDQEMMTVYSVQGKELVATHYCGMGNQPHFKLDLAKSTPRELVFGFDGGPNLDPGKDNHIHDGKIVFAGDGKLESTWSFYGNGQQLASHDFHLTRSAAK